MHRGGGFEFINISSKENNINIKYGRNTSTLFILVNCQDDPIMSQYVNSKPNQSFSQNEGGQLKMTDTLYETYTEDSEFCFSESILNETWKYIKSSFNKAKYQKILKQQKIWIDTGRDESATRYSSQMKDVQAFTQANFDRANELANLVVQMPQPGDYIYTDGEGSMNIKQMEKNTYSIEITTTRGQNLCEFSGNFTYSGKGWARLENDALEDSDLYILFLDNRVVVVPQSNFAFCGVNAYLEGEYSFQN